MNIIDGQKTIICGTIAFLLFGMSMLFTNIDVIANPEIALICNDAGKAVMALGILALKSAIQKVN